MPSPNNEKKIFFQIALLTWYKRNKRAYIWRTTKDPYSVLVAEMMLQQTNAGKVVPVYEAFLQKYPTISKLLMSDEQELISLLKPIGLKYKVTRLKNLAKEIFEKFGGNVPSTKEELLSLPGVGEYIANAVLCFSYSKKLPLVDVNVIRLYERVFSIKSEKKRARDDKRYWEFSHVMLPENYKKFNLALIDFSAKICLNRNPICRKCPIMIICDYSDQNNGKTD